VEYERGENMASSTLQLSRKKVNIAIARMGGDYSVYKLAEDCGVSRQRMTVILNSDNISPSNAGRIAKALNVDVTEIID
jgi:DNA-binding Xre family transcriptional regulator